MSRNGLLVDAATGPAADPAIGADAPVTGHVWASVRKEPLLHFLLAAVAIFALYAVSGKAGEPPPDRIVVSAPKIEQMATVFAAAWQRPPTSDELKALIDDHVKEEILVRQAVALGLDEGDTVVRRRLRQKMEFLNSSTIDMPAATEADLQSYLDDHPEAFRTGRRLSFQQIYLSPQPGSIEHAATLLERLRAAPETDPSQLGDVTLLPSDMPLSSEDDIGRTFGADLLGPLDAAPVGRWAGPFASTFGLHLVRVGERAEGRTPPLDEVREAVSRDWRDARSRQAQDRLMADLLKGYTVTIEDPADAGASR